MPDTVIRVQNLSKRYRLGELHKHTGSFRDKVTQSFKRLVLRGRDGKPPTYASRSLPSSTQPDSGPLNSLNSFNSLNRPAEETPDYIWALMDVSFEVKRGEVLGIIGRNGAGKSTLLKILSRITKPTVGKAWINGRVGSLLEVGTGFHAELTGRENIFLNGAILGMNKNEIKRKFDEIVNFAELERFIDTPVKRYSSGMYVRLAFAVAAHLEPDILLVDEVLAVGDFSFQKKCLGKMDDVARGGKTVLFVSHNMGAIRTLSRTGLMLNNGFILRDGPVSHVIDFYLQEQAQSTSASGQLCWEPNDEPGSDDFALKEIKLITDAGKISSTFSAQEPINVHIHYQLVRNLAGMRIVLQILTAAGEIAFTTTDHSVRKECMWEPGFYKSICHIPGGLLNLGEYMIKAWAGIPGFRYLLEPMDLLRFFVGGRGNQNSIFSETWPGVICPQLSWDVLQHYQ